MKQVNIKTSVKTFFKHWLIFTKPFHKLPPKEIEVLTLLLYHYHIYKKDISNPKLINKLLFDYDTKMAIKKDMGDIKDTNLQNLLTSLRKRRVIIDNQLNPAYIPNIKVNSKEFKLIFNFILDEAEDNKED